VVRRTRAHQVRDDDEQRESNCDCAGKVNPRRCTRIDADGRLSARRHKPSLFVESSNSVGGHPKRLIDTQYCGGKQQRQGKDGVDDW
jgi:hypothetical protein